MNVRERSNWTNKDIEYLKNVNITEYDLVSGGLSVIKEYHLLPDDKIKILDEMDKESKNIAVGKLQIKLKNLAKNMVIGFGNARQLFVDLNNIQDDNILSIKKDAMFLINCYNVNGQVSDNLLFRPKNTYSSYMYINRKELYFTSKTRQLDTKGFSEEVRNKQADYIFKDFSKFMLLSEKGDEKKLMEALALYQTMYLNKELPVETYRNLDTGLFEYGGQFEMDTIDEDYIEDVDVSYNYMTYVLPMIQILLKRGD